MGVILYHGTLTKNIPSILTCGIVPRTEKDCYSLIKEKEKGAKEFVKEYALRRCLDTVGRVSLSGSKQFAIDNCRASLETEALLESSRGGIPESQLWRELKKIPCSVIEAEVPNDVIPKGGGGRWQGKQIGEGLDKAFAALKKIDPKITYEEAKAHFTEFTFDEIPPEWIKTHYPIV